MKVGVLGGGQLGRMLALAGYPLGARFTFLDQSREAPAAQVGDLVMGAFDDPKAIAEVARRAEVLTFDVENIPAEAVRAAGVESLCRPSLAALETAQDRLAEKRCFEELGIPVAPYRKVDDEQELHRALGELGCPAMLKARRLGYDGRGQRLIRGQGEARSALAALGPRDLILEAFVPFEREVSMIGVRSPSGVKACYPLTENRHADGILRLSIAPAADAAMAGSARDYLERVLEHFQYAGVLAVEFFQQGGRLLANEMAPRVHNSGHWTIDGAVASQFENHVRAILDLPLGLAEAVGVSAMANFIGEMPPLAELLAIPGLHVHAYGKSPRPHRKLGHATLVARDAASLERPLQRLLALAWPVERLASLGIGA